MDHHKETLLIIGGTGSLGNCLVRLLSHKYLIVILSRDENKQWLMKQKYPHLKYVIGDIRFKDVIEMKLHEIKPDKVIIAAALKHIDICEYNISECIRTNVTGIQNVVDSIAHISNMGTLPNLNTVCFVSTDKATAPVNVYGMSKALAERIVIEKSLSMTYPKFVCVRYGNVLNSRGSLLPLFHKIGHDEERKAFSVTHPEMTRFFMNLEEAVNLIEHAMDVGESGDTMIPIARAYRILDIATEFSNIYNKPIEITGIRPGEKLHECLINQLERSRTIKQGNVYIIKPCYTNTTVCTADFDFEYTSDISLSNKNSIKDIIIELKEL